MCCSLVYFQDIPGCGKFRKHPLQNEDELTYFQGIVNVGADHWSPCGANAAMAAAPTLDSATQQSAQDEEGAALAGEGAAQGATEGEEVDEVTPSSGSCKRAARLVQDTRKKAKTANAVLIQEACTSMANSANAYAAKKDGKFTIDEVMQAVIACGAEYETNEHYIATELSVKKEQRKMFMTFPTDDIKFKWLSRKYNDKYENK
jgi:hypothetical protein